MKNKVYGFAAVVAATALAAGSLSVSAAGSSTTITVNVTDSSNYELVIPAATTVSDYGWTELASNLKVKGRLTSHKVVEVTFTSDNEFKFANADKNLFMPYSLRQTSDGDAVSSLSFYADDVSETGGDGKSLGVYVSKDDWNAVPGGSYTDVVTFTAEMKDITN